MSNYTKLFVKLLMSVINIRKLIDSYKNSIRDDAKYNKMKSILLNHVRKMLDTYLEYRKLEAKVNSVKSITKKYSHLTLDIVAITKNFIMNDKELEKNLKEIKNVIVKELFIKDKIVEQAISNITAAYALHLSAWIIQCDKILEVNIKDDDMVQALETNKVLQETTLENIIIAYTINIEKLSKYIDGLIAETKRIVQDYEKSRKEAQKSKREKSDSGGIAIPSSTSAEKAKESSTSGKDEGFGVSESGDADKFGDTGKSSSISSAPSKEEGASTNIKRNKKKVTGEPKATKRTTAQKFVAKGPIEAPPKLKVKESEKKLTIAPSVGAKKKSVRAVAKSNITSKTSMAPALVAEAPLKEYSTESKMPNELVSELQKVVEAAGKTIKGGKVSSRDLEQKQKKKKGKDLDSLIKSYDKLEKQQSKLLQSIMKLRDKIAKALAEYNKMVKNAKGKKKEELSNVEANKLIAKLLKLSDTQVANKKSRRGEDKGTAGAIRSSVSDSESDARAVADLIKQQGERSSVSEYSGVQAEKNEIIINQNNTNEVNNINLSTQDKIEKEQASTKAKRSDKSSDNFAVNPDLDKDDSKKTLEKQDGGRIDSSESVVPSAPTQSGAVSVTSSASKEVKPIPKEGEGMPSRREVKMGGAATGRSSMARTSQEKSTSVSESRSRKFLGTAREKLIEGLANAKTKFMYALQGVKGFSTKMFGGILNGLGWMLKILSPFTFLFSKAFSVGAAFKALDTQTKLADLDKRLNEAVNQVIVGNFESSATSAQRVIDTLRGERAREQIGEYTLISDKKNITASGTTQAQKFGIKGGSQTSSPPKLGRQAQAGAEASIGFNTREEDIKMLKQQQDELNKQLLEMQKRLLEYQRQTMETDQELSDAMSESHQTQMQLEVINHQSSIKTAANLAEKRELYSY